MTINNEEREFTLERYVTNRTSQPPLMAPMALKEDITKLVQKEYPNAESVYTLQEVISLSNDPLSLQRIEN